MIFGLFFIFTLTVFILYGVALVLLKDIPYSGVFLTFGLVLIIGIEFSIAAFFDANGFDEEP